MILTSFDTVGEALYDERLRAIKKHIEDDGIVGLQAAGLLRAWIHSLEHGLREGHLGNAFAARRSINLLDTWLAEVDERYSSNLRGAIEDLDRAVKEFIDETRS